MREAPAERFDEIYRLHVEAVRAYVRRRAPAARVDDVTAETFAVCWRKLDRVPREPLPWLYAVARKTLANERRAEARQARAMPAEREAEPIPLPSDPALGVAFGRLSEADREVLCLVAWEGLSLGEAARVLGCSGVACRVRFHRAKRRLATRLTELESEGPGAAARRRPDPEGATR